MQADSLPSEPPEKPILTILSSKYLLLISGIYIGASLVAQLIKNPPAMQETLVHFLGWEDPLEKGKATHSSILVLGVSQEFDTTEQLSWASGEIFKEQIRNTLKINISNI